MSGPPSIAGGNNDDRENDDQEDILEDNLGAEDRGSGGKNVIFSNRPYDKSKYSDPLIYVPI